MGRRKLHEGEGKLKKLTIDITASGTIELELPDDEAEGLATLLEERKLDSESMLQTVLDLAKQDWMDLTNICNWEVDVA